MKDFTKSVEKYLKSQENKNHGRYKSWEYCYTVFYEAIKNNKLKKYDIDYLSLHLAFYLASWGMYRASSFLLQKDYKIHNGVVKIVLENKDLLGIDCKLILNSKIDNIIKLKNDIGNYYQKYYDRTTITDTLSSKIILGTLGCIPAYDRYFKIGINEIDNKIQKKLNEKSIKSLCTFYEKNYSKLERIRKQYKFDKMTYPQMKLIDMCFWQIGKDKSKS